MFLKNKVKGMLAMSLKQRNKKHFPKVKTTKKK
jgi:hypothetical protein